jgi:hypothetical protein
MTGKQSLIAFLGLALVIANAWTAPGKPLQSLTSGKIATDTTPGHSWYQTPWGKIGYETLAIIIATFVGTMDGAASVILVFLVGLWILYLMRLKGQPAGTQNPAVVQAGASAGSLGTSVTSALKGAF